MSTDFPTSLDSLPRPVDPQTESLADNDHSGMHDSEQDAIEALEAKVGIDGSGNTASLDYKTTQSDAHLASTTEAHPATAVTFDPAGLTNTTATEVQSALEEIDAAIVDANGVPPSAFDAAGDLLQGTGADTYARLARGAANTVLAGNAAGTDIAWRDVYSIPQTLDTVQADSFTVALDQAGQWIPCEADDITPRVITLPQNSDVAVPVGSTIVLEFLNDVEWTISAGSGASISSQTGVSGDPRPTGNGAIVVLFKKATNEWRVFGDITTEHLDANEHGFHPMRLSPPSDDIMSTAWGYNTNGVHNRTFTEESSPGTRRLWVAQINKDRHPILSRRTTLSQGGTVPSGWTKIDLTTKFTASSGIIGKDGHRYLSMHIDSDGYTHVMGNMHLDPVSGNYCVNRVPYSMTLTDFVPAIFETGATVNTQMTYPQFVECSDGTFILTYRDSSATGGADHRANQYIKRYTPDGSAPPASGANSKWGTAVLFCNGIDDPTEFGCIYLSRIATDPRDRATHWIFFHWRNDDDETVEKLGCIVTHDDFSTFELADGTPVTLPFDRTDYTGAMVVDNVPNQANTSFTLGGACVDWVPMDPTDPNSLGRPHVAYTKSASGIVLHRAYWDGAAWVVESTGSGMATSPNSPALIADPNGGTYMLFTVNAVGKVGSVRMFDCTPGSAYTYADVEIINLEVNPGGDVGISQQAQLDFNEAHFVVGPGQVLADNDTTSSDVPYQTECYVASLDTLRLADICAGRATPLRSKRVADVGIPGVGTEVTVVSASVVDLGMPRIGYKPYGGIYVARFVGVAKIDGTAVMDIHIGQQHTGGTTASQLAATVSSTSYDVVETEWLPLRTLLFLSKGEVSVWAGITSGTGNGYLRGVLQLQQIPVERLA